MATDSILSGVPDTTYIPLVACIYVSRRLPEYFHEEQILGMIAKMKLAFPQGELVFDATNSDGLKFTNKYVQKTGNTDAMMYFGLDDPAGFADRAGCQLLEVSGFYADALKLGRRLSLRTRIYRYFADKRGRTLVVHLQL